MGTLVHDFCQEIAIIGNLYAREGKIIHSQDEVGGYPQVPPGPRPAGGSRHRRRPVAQATTWMP